MSTAGILAGDRERQTTATDTTHATYRVCNDVLDAIDELVEDGEYPNRSAAIRAATDHLVRSTVDE